jgi:hypothetical protein
MPGWRPTKDSALNWFNVLGGRSDDHLALVFQRLAISRVHRTARLEHRQPSVHGDRRLQGGTYGAEWVIDPTQTPVLNRAFRDWDTDFFALLKANNMSVVCSFSQELVNPPDDPLSSVLVQRFPDGTPVETATGFGILNSSQIAFSSGPQSYMGQAYGRNGGPDAGGGAHAKAAVRRDSLVVSGKLVRDGVLRC